MTRWRRRGKQITRDRHGVAAHFAVMLVSLLALLVPLAGCAASKTASRPRPHLPTPTATPDSPLAHMSVTVGGDAVYTLRASDGKLFWHWQTPSDPHGDEYALNVWRVGDIITFISGPRRTLYALDARTGTPVWQQQLADNVTYVSPVSDGVVYAGTGGPQYTSEGDVLAVRVSDGTILWRAATDGNVVAAPITVGDRVYAVSTSVYALHAQTGQQVWRTTVGKGLSRTPIITGGILYEPSDDGYLYALRASDGTLLWRFPFHSFGNTPVVVSEGMVYVSGAHVDYSGNRVVYVIDATSGALRSQITTQDPLSSLAVDSGTLYGGSYNGYLYAYDVKTGTQRWRDQTYIFAGTPVIAQGIVFIYGPSSSNFVAAVVAGSVQAIDAATGACRWDYRINIADRAQPILGAA